MKSTDFVYFFAQPAHRTIGKTERQANIEITTEPWTCRWRYRGLERLLTVPAGYVWDGASVPRVAWTIIGLTPWGLTDGPSLAHDPLYRAKGGAMPDKWADCTLTDNKGAGVRIDRAEADWVFYAACVAAGIKRPRAGLAYGVVRTFGGPHWGGPLPATGRTTR